MSSESAANLILMPSIRRARPGEQCERIIDGTFLGNTNHLNMPAFLNFGNLLNPHILICGMTGGGKTYLAKSLFVRMHMFSGSNILLIDFTGEYLEAASNLPSISPPEMERLFEEEQGVMYVDLHELPEREKIARASELFDRAAELMRKRGLRHKSGVMILIDEAWKLIEKNRGARDGHKGGQEVRRGVDNIIAASARYQHEHTLKYGNGLHIQDDQQQKPGNSVQRLQSIREGTPEHTEPGPRELLCDTAPQVRNKVRIHHTQDNRNTRHSSYKNQNRCRDGDRNKRDRIRRDGCFVVRQRQIGLSKREIRENCINLPGLVAKLIENGAERREILPETAENRLQQFQHGGRLLHCHKQDGSVNAKDKNRAYLSSRISLKASVRTDMLSVKSRMSYYPATRQLATGTRLTYLLDGEEQTDRFHVLELETDRITLTTHSATSPTYFLRESVLRLMSVSMILSEDYDIDLHGLMPYMIHVLSNSDALVHETGPINFNREADISTFEACHRTAGPEEQTGKHWK